MGVDVKALVDAQQAIMEQMRMLLESVGIELYLDTIVLSPRDCEEDDGNHCIDFVWRLRCRDAATCAAFREQLRAGMGTGGPEEGAEAG